MAKIITIFLAFCLIFSLALIVYAHAEDTSEEALEDETVNAEDLDNKEPNLLPGDPLYFVKEWGRAIRGVFAFGQLKKAELNQDIANERLLELKKLVEEGKVSQEVLEKTIEKYERTLEKIKDQAQKIEKTASEDENVNKFLDKFTKQQVLHEKILDELENKVPDGVLQKIEEAREQHLQRFKEIMQKLETNKERVAEKIKNALQNGDENDSEILERIKEKMPDEVKQKLEAAKTDIINRIIQKAVQKNVTNNCPPIEKPSPGFCKLGTVKLGKNENGCIVRFICDTAPENNIKNRRPILCTQDYNPVCGKDGKTYSNKCFAEIAGVEVEQKGECEEKPPVSGIECKKDADCPRALRPCVPESDGTLICPEPKCVEGKCTIVFVPSKENSSGIKGKISYGPTQPGPCTSGVNCDDAPYNGKIIIKSKDKSQIIATSETDNNGEFKISLDPQIYFLEVDRKFIITCGKLVEVRPSEYTEVEISCDTGIR